MTLPAAIIQGASQPPSPPSPFPSRRAVSFPAVIPPANRYQMGKIELVTVALIIIT